MPFKDSKVSLRLLVLSDGNSYDGEISIGGRFNHFSNPKRSIRFIRKLRPLQDQSDYSPSIPFHYEEDNLELLIEQSRWGLQSNYHDSPKPDFDIDKKILDYLDTTIRSLWSEIFDILKLKPVKLTSLGSYRTSPLFFERAKQAIKDRTLDCLTLAYTIPFRGEEINQGLGFRSQEEIEEDERLAKQQIIENPHSPARARSSGYGNWVTGDGINRGTIDK